MNDVKYYPVIYETPNLHFRFTFAYIFLYLPTFADICLHTAGIHAAGIHATGIHAAGIHATDIHAAGIHTLAGLPFIIPPTNL